MTFIVWTAVCKYDGVTPATDRVHSSQAKVLVVVSADSCDHCMMTRTASHHVTQAADITPVTRLTLDRITPSQDDANMQPPTPATTRHHMT